jgi:hypothetical protein
VVGDELDLEYVQHPGAEALLGGVDAVQHHVAIAGGSLGLRHTRLDAIGDEVDLLVTVFGRRAVGRHEDRHAVVVVVVVVAVPVIDEIARTPPVMTVPVVISSSHTIRLGPALGRWAATSGTSWWSQSCSRSPPAPKGLSMSSPGPLMNPSKDIDMYRISRDMTLPFQV